MTVVFFHQPNKTTFMAEGVLEELSASWLRKPDMFIGRAPVRHDPDIPFTSQPPSKSGITSHPSLRQAPPFSHSTMATSSHPLEIILAWMVFNAANGSSSPLRPQKVKLWPCNFVTAPALDKGRLGSVVVDPNRGVNCKPQLIKQVWLDVLEIAPP